MLSKQLVYKQIKVKSYPSLPSSNHQRFLSPPVSKSNLLPFQGNNHKRTKSRFKVSSFSEKCANKHKGIIHLINKTLTQSELNIPLSNNIKGIASSTLLQLVKTEPVLPYLTKSSAVSKFIIRAYRPVNETQEYIQSTKAKETISDNFFILNEEQKKKRLRNRLEYFEKNKKGTIYEKEDSTGKSKPIFHNHNTNPNLADIKALTSENEQLRESQIKEEGKNLANLLFCIDKDEKIELLDDYSNKHDISRKNLHNVLNRRRIMKAKGKFNDEEEALGISDLNQMKQDRLNTEYELSKKVNYIGAPKFLKSRFLRDTSIKFKGVNGKYFGVIC